MKIKAGCDIVKISRFASLNNKSLEKIFHKNELKKSKMNPETLAGMFAAKESCKKIFNYLDWHDMEIKKTRNGKPMLLLNKTKESIISSDLTIAHDGDYAVAFAAFIIK